MKGWGPKSSACGSKPRKTKLFWRDISEFWAGYPGIFGGMSGDARQKEKFVFSFWPLFQCTKIFFQYKGGVHAVNEGFGEDVFR